MKCKHERVKWLQCLHKKTHDCDMEVYWCRDCGALKEGGRWRRPRTGISDGCTVCAMVAENRIKGGR